MAHMPTYYAAAGREAESRTTLTSIKDQAGQMKLKYRKSGQSTSEDIGDREKVLENLKTKEASELSKKDDALSYVMSEEKKVLLLSNAPATMAATTVANVAGKYNDADAGINRVNEADDDGFDSSSDEE